MTSQNQRKLNRLLTMWLPGMVATAKWLKNNGISQQLAYGYLKSGWLEKLEQGAYIRPKDRVDWLGGIYAMQNQLGLSIHPGGKTALELKGFGHFIGMNPADVLTSLYGQHNEKLPSWFLKHDWKRIITYIPIHLFEDEAELGLTDYEQPYFTVKISSPERAIMEYLHGLPDKATFEEGELLMQGMLTLRPKVVQTLLENCCSIKVKRAFLYLAKRLEHSWFKKLNLETINLGSGKRMIVKDGRLDKDFLITVPKESFEK